MRGEFKNRELPDRILSYAIATLQRTHNKTRTRSMNNETCEVIRETLINPLPHNDNKWSKTNITYS